MPLYEYQCDACGKRFEVIQKFSDGSVDACRHCGNGPVHRLPSSPAIQFKGSGWYITDYAQKGKSDGAQKSGDDAPAGDAGKSDAGKGDAAKSDGATAATAAKTETKTKTDSAPAPSAPAKTSD
jgi:putative FmdB family regulatory protein